MVKEHCFIFVFNLKINTLYIMNSFDDKAFDLRLFK